MKGLLFALLSLIAFGSLGVHADGTDCDGVGYASVLFASSNGTQLYGRLFRAAAGGEARAVVVLHGSGGLFKTPSGGAPTPLGSLDSLAMENEFCEWATLLRDRGYHAFFPDSYASRGFYELSDGNPQNISGAQQQTFRTLDSFGALAAVCAQPHVDCSCRSLIGFSKGAEVAMLTQFWRLDTLPDVWPYVAADVLAGRGYEYAVPWYGGCGFYGTISLEDANEAKWNDSARPFYYPRVGSKMTMLLGEFDALRSPACQPTREWQTGVVASHLGATNAVTFTTYAGVGHGFDSGPLSNASEAMARYSGRNLTLANLCSPQRSDSSSNLTAAASVSSALGWIFG